MATGNLVKWREYLQKTEGGDIKEGEKLKEGAMERLVSQRVREAERGGREGEQDKFGGES